MYGVRRVSGVMCQVSGGSDVCGSLCAPTSTIISLDGTQA